MRKPKTLTPKTDRPNAHLEERAAAVRKGKGKLLKPKGETAAPEPAAADLDAAPEEAPPLGMVRVPADAHPGTYGLQLDEGGLGLHAPPDSSIIVEPVTPTGAGLAVFYFKGAGGPTVFDLTHDFMPEFAVPFAPGSEVVPLIEMIEPTTGQFGRVRADRVEKIHRVTGIYTPINGAEDHPRAPTPLPLLSECPEGMGEQYVRENVAYPLVRPGEVVVYDPSRREPTHGSLCVLQWNNGTRDVMLTNRRPVGSDGAERWFVDPVNRPASREALERRLKENRPGDVLHASDGPYELDHLREKIVGTVVGVLVPGRKGSTQGQAFLMPPPSTGTQEGQDPSRETRQAESGEA